MLRRTLERRAKRRLCITTSLPPEVGRVIDATISSLREMGLIDDEAFAAGRARSLAQRGYSRTRIARGLGAKGITGKDAQAALPDDFDETAQARRYAERRRLGPWRRGAPSPETRRKDLAALARAGFSLDVARRALALTTDE